MGTHRARSSLVRTIATLALACAPEFKPPDVQGWAGESQVADAIAKARAKVIEAPQSAPAVGALGQVLHAHEQHGEALVCYRRAMELDPAAGRWPYLAALAMAKSDLESSVELFERAAALAKGQAAVRLGLGDVLIELGRCEAAGEQYRTALGIEPASSHALYGLANCALETGDVEAARDHLEAAAEAEPSHGEVHALLARVYRRLGEDARAELAQWRAAAFPDPTAANDPWWNEVRAAAVSSRSYTERGRALAAAGRFEEAEREFRRVLEIRPGNPRDYSNLGAVLTRQGRLDEAVVAFHSALAIDGSDTYTLNNLSLALAAAGDLARALELLQKAIEIDPAYADAHHNLGSLRARQGERKLAIEHFRKALEANPAHLRAGNDLATELARSGNLDGAAAQWTRILEIDPRELTALFNLSNALILNGEHDRAIGWLRQGVEIAPNSSRLVSLLAWELATAPGGNVRDPVEAEQLARRVYEAYPDEPRSGDVLAAALAAQGRFEEALPLAEQALERARASGRLRLAAEIALRLGLYRQRRAFDQSLMPAPGLSSG